MEKININGTKNIDLKSQLESLQELQNFGPTDLLKKFFSSEDSSKDAVKVDYSKQVYQMLEFFRMQSGQEVEGLITKTFSHFPVYSTNCSIEKNYA